MIFSMLFKKATILNLFPSRISQKDIRIADGIIAGTGEELVPNAGEEVIDLNGKYLLPGLINAHTHLYSSLARGMPPPKSAPFNFVEILQKVWWRLDEALDDESVYYSALVGAIESIKRGTTTIIDHHASPNCINGSLDLIKKALNETGMRGVLCYETTDRGGVERRVEGLRENDRFIKENFNDSKFRGLIGAHASFTLDDETLDLLSELVRNNKSGLHIHVAEDKADVEDALNNRHLDIIERLESRGLLNSKSILAHCVHLSKKQIEKVTGYGTWIIHNPRSNMNNAIGYAPLNWLGKNSSIGTDGFPSDMFEEAKIAYFRNAESPARVDIARFPEMLQTANKYVANLFNGKFGALEPGNVADLVVLDYIPPTPFTNENFVGHFLFGMNSSIVESVMIDGNWVVKNREVVGLDVSAIYAKATKVARKLWDKMEYKLTNA